MNAAAYTDVNGTESDEAQASPFNAGAVRVIAEEAAKLGARVVHFVSIASCY